MGGRVVAEFRVLGRIEVSNDGRPVDVGHARRQSVLAVLLVEVNRVVAVDQLVERVWGAHPVPRDPRSALRTYLWHLRGAFATVRDVALVRRAPGYELVADERQVDLHRFRDLLARTDTAGDDDKTAALIEQALGLWRGEPFAGLDTPWIDTTRQNLLLHRHAAQLNLTDIHLRHGQHMALLTELTGQAAGHPLDERIASQLMLALYRSGRAADALAEYRRIRKQLADELGADPGAPLQQLHQQILTADSALAPTASGKLSVPTTTAKPDTVADRGATAVRGCPAPVPRQLPAAPRLFTGRTRELERLRALLDQQAGSSRMQVISAIGGMGKTWLALHWAHQNLDRFPDGQLHVDLRGFDPCGPPMEPRTAVRGFLEALGVAHAAMPVDPDAQVGQYRSLLADKRMLIVLDNARDAAQVVPLLPGSPTCTVLVTSRRRLTGLITGHGALCVDLDVLPEDDAHRLLARYLGHDRVSAEPDTLAALLRCCAGLPLALGIVAARALAHPDLPLALLADELRDASTRLDALTTDDPSANVRAAIRASYDALDPQAAGALTLLALAPGPDTGLRAAASLLARPTATARTLLRDLENASLLQQHAPGRYRMHDLVRLYANARSERQCTSSGDG